jgi:short-subunit dehydrogenase
MSGSWLIIGATSSIAAAFARKAAAEGCHLLLAGRDEAELQLQAADLKLRGAASASTLVLDVTKPDLAQLQRHTETLPRPLSVYYAAGLMPEEAALRIEPELHQQMITTNYGGATQILDALLPQLEAQRAGAVILIGSVAGDRGRKKNFRYGATKAALAVYAQGLAAHLSGFNVPVLLVKPGIIDTAMTWGLKNPPLPAGPPSALATACWQRAPKGGNLYFPWFWRFIMLIIVHLPRQIFNRLNF